MPKTDSALTSASATGVAGSMTQPQSNVQARSADSAPPAAKPAAPERLDRPGNARAVAQGDGSILVSWDAPANGDADVTYRVRRRANSGGGKYRVILRSIGDGGGKDADSGSGKISYRDDGSTLNAGQTYTYSVRAFHPSIKKSKWTSGASSE